MICKPRTLRWSGQLLPPPRWLSVSKTERGLTGHRARTRVILQPMSSRSRERDPQIFRSRDERQQQVSALPGPYRPRWRPATVRYLGNIQTQQVAAPDRFVPTPLDGVLKSLAPPP